MSWSRSMGIVARIGGEEWRAGKDQKPGEGEQRSGAAEQVSEVHGRLATS
jgi:hypothetical protein